jgi:hypothetical protein
MIMNYRNIINKVAYTFDPDKNIIVTIVNDTDLGEAHFVVANIEYFCDSELRVPFVIYNDGKIFMPRDWQSGELPQTTDEIEDINWVTYPNAHDAVIKDGLPRIFTGEI